MNFLLLVVIPLGWALGYLLGGVVVQAWERRQERKEQEKRDQRYKEERAKWEAAKTADHQRWDELLNIVFGDKK